MPGKTLIGGTVYTVKGGKTLTGGTAYTIGGGKTLVNGTAYSIKMSDGASIRLIADFTNAPSSGTGIKTDYVSRFGMEITGPDNNNYASFVVGVEYSDVGNVDYTEKKYGKIYHDYSFEAPLNSSIAMGCAGTSGGAGGEIDGLKIYLNGNLVASDDKTIMLDYTLEGITGDVTIVLNDPTDGVYITMEG